MKTHANNSMQRTALRAAADAERSVHHMPSLFSHVFERDRHRCVYCGKYMLLGFETFQTSQLDHLVPGGADTPDNLVLACFVCNNFRGTFVPGGVTVAERAEYIHLLQVHVISRRAERMRDFASWTHPVAPDT